LGLLRDGKGQSRKEFTERFRIEDVNEGRTPYLEQLEKDICCIPREVAQKVSREYEVSIESLLQNDGRLRNFYGKEKDPSQDEPKNNTSDPYSIANGICHSCGTQQWAKAITDLAGNLAKDWTLNGADRSKYFRKISRLASQCARVEEVFARGEGLEQALQDMNGY
jgi:hypothetical protein